MRVEARGDEEEVGEPVEEDADDLVRVGVGVGVGVGLGLPLGLGFGLG